MNLSTSCILILLAMAVAVPLYAQGQGAAPCSVLTAASEEMKAAARARVQTAKVRSELLGREVAYNLILPHDYAASGLRYPVLYLLHGSYDNHKAWNDKSGVAAYVAALPLIVVMPDAAMSRYINSPGLGPYEDFFLKEFVPHIDRTYRTLPRRAGRALAGLSMGGYGAWRLGLDAPETFVAAAALSGSFEWGETGFANERYRERAIQVYGGEGPEQSRLYAADRLWPHVEKNLGPDVKWRGPALYFTIGTEDFLLDANRLMRRRMEERKIPFVAAEYPGAHTWAFWDAHVPDALTFILRHLAAPTGEKGD